jgi:hypothetical protein
MAAASCSLNLGLQLNRDGSTLFMVMMILGPQYNNKAGECQFVEVMSYPRGDRSRE